MVVCGQILCTTCRRQRSTVVYFRGKRERVVPPCGGRLVVWRCSRDKSRAQEAEVHLYCSETEREPRVGAAAAAAKGGSRRGVPGQYVCYRLFRLRICTSRYRWRRKGREEMRLSAGSTAEPESIKTAPRRRRIRLTLTRCGTRSSKKFRNLALTLQTHKLSVKWTWFHVITQSLRLK